jgi:four helix bundle protein
MSNGPSKNFRELIVWQKAHQLALRTYQLTNNYPKEELFGLTSQMRRAAVSVPANIAEGYRKRGKADKARFLNISEGSLDELNYYFILSKDLNHITDGQYNELNQHCIEVSKMLNAYGSAIRSNPNP